MNITLLIPNFRKRVSLIFRIWWRKTKVFRLPSSLLLEFPLLFFIYCISVIINNIFHVLRNGGLVFMWTMLPPYSSHGSSESTRDFIYLVYNRASFHTLSLCCSLYINIKMHRLRQDIILYGFCAMAYGLWLNLSLPHLKYFSNLSFVFLWIIFSLVIYWLFFISKNAHKLFELRLIR